jgi:hypothetical protein
MWRANGCDGLHSGAQTCLCLDLPPEHEVLLSKLYPSMVLASGDLNLLPDRAVPFPVSFSLRATKT